MVVELFQLLEYGLLCLLIGALDECRGDVPLCGILGYGVGYKLPYIVSLYDIGAKGVEQRVEAHKVSEGLVDTISLEVINIDRLVEVVVYAVMRLLVARHHNRHFEPVLHKSLGKSYFLAVVGVVVDDVTTTPHDDNVFSERLLIELHIIAAHLFVCICLVVESLVGGNLLFAFLGGDVEGFG